MREMANDFAAEDRRVAAEYYRDATWPQQLVNKASAIGLMNAPIPIEYGGAGASYLEEAAIAEELAWGDPATATTIGERSRFGAGVLGGSAETQPEYLGRLSKAPLLASFARGSGDNGSLTSDGETE